MHHSGFYFVLLIAFCMTLAVSGTASVLKHESREKYIKFSHKFHIDDVGADCQTCHSAAANSTKAEDNILAHKDDCLECHDGSTAGEDCEICHYDPDTAVNFPNPARQLLFNHKAHLERISSSQACERCHKGLEEVTYSVPENLPVMEGCIECHDNKSAPQYCETCHTHLPTLRPETHLANWMHRHDDAVRATSEDCAMCHSFNYCQECHDGAILAGIDSGIPGKYSPNATQSWGVKNLILTRNHDLNYRYTHALEAKSKIENCGLCHENESFCVECHQVNFGSGAIQPEWHGGTGWGAIAFGVGSGGGRHAQMAKRDIALCASCHDPSGEDPVCLVCHMDRTPGRNNDPRTHSKNSYRYNGPWHDDRSFTCYTCHVNAESKNPAGFCGYCHPIK